MRKTKLIILLVGLVATGFAPGARAQAPEAATAMVESFHESLITVMRHAEEWEYDKRRETLAPEIRSMFDISFMARVAAGSYWKSLSAEEQARLTDVFRTFTIANYAARFNGYSGQHFKTVARKSMGNRLMVKTQLVKANGDKIGLDYILRPEEDGWCIIDIYMDGKYSELATRRSEFAPILRDTGIDGLLNALEKKIAELESAA